MFRETGKPIAHVARELGTNEGTLGNWVAKDRRRGEEPDDQVSEAERVELVRLRRVNAQLRMEKEILKKALRRMLWVAIGADRGVKVG